MAKFYLSDYLSPDGENCKALTSPGVPEPQLCQFKQHMAIFLEKY